VAEAQAAEAGAKEERERAKQAAAKMHVLREASEAHRLEACEERAASDKKAQDHERARRKAEQGKKLAEDTAREQRLEAQEEVRRVRTLAEQNRKDAEEAQQKLRLLLRARGHLIRAPADLRNDHALARALHVSHVPEVLQRKQVAVAGIAGSGKSTLVNRFLKEHGYEGGPPPYPRRCPKSCETMSSYSL
jgi:ABC-type uncharacterized transport system ATPase subunit